MTAQLEDRIKAEALERGRWYGSAEACSAMGLSRDARALLILANKGVIESRPVLAKTGSILRWEFRRA